jgi:hypothetical protein
MASERSTRARASNMVRRDGSGPPISGSRWLSPLETTGACRRFSACAKPCGAGHLLPTAWLLPALGLAEPTYHRLARAQGEFGAVPSFGPGPKKR